MGEGLYRAMLADADGKPALGNTANHLGLRFPGCQGKSDVDICSKSKKVIANKKGMSVANRWRNLPVHRIPKRLEGVLPGAAGRNELKCFRLADFSFIEQAIGNHLFHFIERQHGCICPTKSMSREAVESALASTQSDWLLDES